MKVQFVASIAPIVRDAGAARSFYRDALGPSGFLKAARACCKFTHQLEGTKHFGLWPLSEAARACFRQHSVAGRHSRPPSQHPIRSRSGHVPPQPPN